MTIVNINTSLHSVVFTPPQPAMCFPQTSCYMRQSKPSSFDKRLLLRINTIILNGKIERVACYQVTHEERCESENDLVVDDCKL